MSAMAVAGCGDNSKACGPGTIDINGVCTAATNPGSNCGPGTVEANGICVPDGSSLCQTGTVWDESTGTCIPDGSLICETGTTYSPDTGTCVPDILGCGPNMVVIDGICVDRAAVTPDVTEAEEPNDFANPQPVELPAAGAMTTIGGCITPADGTTDIDTYAITVSEPTLIDLTVDGYGGLAGGFVVLAADPQLGNADWIRYGINLVGDMAQRELFLPKAGTYLIGILDSRTILTDQAAGNQDSCYLATLRTVELPAAAPIADIATGELSGQVHFYRVIAEDAALLFNLAEAPGEAVLIDLVVLRNGAYYDSSPGLGARDFGERAATDLGGLSAGDEILLVVDPVINYAITPAFFDVRVLAPAVVPLPETGSIGITSPTYPEELPFSFTYFDVADNDIVALALDTDSRNGVRMLITDTDLRIVSRPCDQACKSHTGSFYFPRGGRYYLALLDTTTPRPAEFQLSVRKVTQQPMPLAVGTPITGKALGPGGSDFYLLTPGAFAWWSFTGQAQAFAGNMSVTLYRNGQGGRLGSEVAAVDSFALGPQVDVGRILDDSPALLLQVSDAGFRGTPGTYEMIVAERPFTNLGTITEDTPYAAANVAIGAGETQRYVAFGAPFSMIDIGVTGLTDLDAVITQLDRSEGVITTINQTGDNGVETAAISLRADPQWTAFTITDNNLDAGAYDLAVSASTQPSSYTIIRGTLPFDDVCSAGAELPVNNPDDGLTLAQTLPFPVSLLGAQSTRAIISTNGFLSLAPVTINQFSNAQIPSSTAPNHYIAPLWDDLVMDRICALVETDRVVVQWVGVAYENGASIEMQVVMHRDGSLDLIYGPNHTHGSDSATIGLENLDGTSGLQIGYDEPNLAAPGTSWTLRPR